MGTRKLSGEASRPCQEKGPPFHASRPRAAFQGRMGREKDGMLQAGGIDHGDSLKMCFFVKTHAHQFGDAATTIVRAEAKAGSSSRGRRIRPARRRREAGSKSFRSAPSVWPENDFRLVVGIRCCQSTNTDRYVSANLRAMTPPAGWGRRGLQHTCSSGLEAEVQGEESGPGRETSLPASACNVFSSVHFNTAVCQARSFCRRALWDEHGSFFSRRAHAKAERSLMQYGGGTSRLLPGYPHPDLQYPTCLGGRGNHDDGNLQ